MQLPGRLERTTLGDVLGALYRAELTGGLLLIDGRSRVHQVRLVRGRPAAVDTALDAPQLGELLLHQRNDPALRRAIERAVTGRASRPLGTLLLEQGLISKLELECAVMDQTEARLDAIFGLTHAAVRLTVRAKGEHLVGALPLCPERFLHGRPRASARKAASREAVPAAATFSPRQAALRLLGFERGEPTESEIRRAFRLRAARLHPDRWLHDCDRDRVRRTREFVALTAAYHALVA